MNYIFHNNSSLAPSPVTLARLFFAPAANAKLRQLPLASPANAVSYTQTQEMTDTTLRYLLKSLISRLLAGVDIILNVFFKKKNKKNLNQDDKATTIRNQIRCFFRLQPFSSSPKTTGSLFAVTSVLTEVQPLLCHTHFFYLRCQCKNVNYDASHMFYFFSGQYLEIWGEFSKSGPLVGKWSTHCNKYELIPVMFL